MTTTQTLTGHAAIDHAEQHGLTLSMYTSPIEEGRDGLSVDEARDVAREDESLIYVTVAS